MISSEEIPEPLLARIGRFDRLEYPEQGMTSEVAFAGDVVVKRATNPLYRDWLRREHEVLQALGSTGLRVASVLGYLDRGDELWLLTERLPGEQLELVLAREQDRQLRDRLLADVGTQLARVHATPVPAALVDDRPFLDRMLAEAADNLAHHQVDGDAALLERVRRERPADVPPRLIHGDFSPDNVLVADGRVTAFIDWSGGGAGDPRMDVAFATDPLDLPDPGDRAAFHEGYGQPPLDPVVLKWFLDLYEFF